MVSNLLCFFSFLFFWMTLDLSLLFFCCCSHCICLKVCLCISKVKGIFERSVAVLLLGHLCFKIAEIRSWHQQLMKEISLGSEDLFRFPI